MGFSSASHNTAHAAGERGMSAARGKVLPKDHRGRRSLSCKNKGTVFVMKHRSLIFIPLPCIVVIHSGSGIKNSVYASDALYMSREL